MSNGTSNGRNGNGNGLGKVSWEWVWRITAGALLPLVFVLAGVVANLNSRIVDLEKVISAIQSNRFTAREGADLQRQIDRKADANNVPPPWFLRRVDSIDGRVKDLEEDCRGR